MTVQLTSSEAIAKALKGSGLSLDEKIGIATETWTSSSIFFPHKDEFLLEWVCGSLVKVTTKGTEKLGETACLNQGYWTLLKYLLDDILHKSKAFSKSATSPALRLPFILAFTSLVQYLATLPSLEDDFKCPKELLETARLCLHYFMTDLSTMYRPSFDQLTSLVMNTLQAIVLHSGQPLKTEDVNFMDIDKKDEAHQILLTSLVKFANETLPSFDALLVTTPNQKKILQMVVGKLLLPLLKVKQIFSGDSQGNSKDSKILASNIIDILRHGLFHPENMFEYMTLLQQLSESTGDRKVNYSNSKQLFDQIQEFTRGEDVEPDAVFSMLPTLFNLFVTEFRNRRKQPSAGLGAPFSRSSKNSLDIIRVVEFEFFMELLKIIKEHHHFGSHQWWQSTILFKSLYGLLQELLELNVYLPSNDTISKRQFSILSNVTKDMVDALQVLKDDGILEGLMFRSLNVILQIDHLILEPHIGVLWKPMIMPLGEAESNANIFATTLLQIYSKLRQLDVYMDGLLLAFRKIDIFEVDNLLRKPMFSRDFLNKFSACITTDLPSSQSPSIFSRFVDELSFSSPSKKRKRTSAARSASPALNSPPQLTALYLSKFVLSLQKPKFDLIVARLFDNFVGPVIDEFIGGDRKDPEFEMSFVAPALEIHYAMVLSVQSYTESFGKAEWVTGLMNNEIRDARVCLGVCKVILQQVHAEVEKGNPDWDLQRKLVEHVLKTFENCVRISATWNGLLMELNWSNLHVAIWKIISEDWLDVVCLLATQEQLQMITLVIVDSFLSLETTDVCLSIDQLSVNSLNIRLLHSAHFYELIPIRECFVQVFLSHLFNFLKSLIDQYHQIRKSATMPIDIITTISKPIHLRTFLAEVDHLFSSSALETKYPREHAIACTTITMYMSIVHLFPIEYFDKQERNCLLVTAFLVDRWVSGLDVEGAKGKVARLKCSLICRDAQLKIMKYLNNAGVLSYNPSFFNWLISSTFKYVNERSEETTQLVSSILITTEAMEKLALRNIFSQIVAKTEDFILDPQAYLHNILKPLRDQAFSSDSQGFMKWLGNNDEVQPENSTALQFFNIYVDSALAQMISTVKPAIRVKKEEMNTDVPRTRRPDALAFIEFYISLETAVTGVMDTFRSFLELKLDQIDVLSNDTKKGELANIMVAKMVSMKPYLHMYGSILRCRRIMDNRDNLSVVLTYIAHLASPLVRFLQLLLQLTSFSKVSDSLQKVLEVMSDYAAILCDVMGDHANPLDPLPVVAVVWYIYGLTYVSGQELVASQLLDAFGLCLKTMRNEHFDIIVHNLLNYTLKDSLSDVMLEKGIKAFVDDTTVFIQFARVLFLKVRTGQKRRLLRSISSFIAKFGLILATIQSIDLVWNILDLLALLCSDKAIDLRIYDISQILSCISLLTNPAAAHRFQCLSDIKANMLFNVIYRILSGILRFHRAQLVETIPPFTALIEILFHCFKSAHPSLASKHIKASRRQDPFPLLTSASPLNEQSARNFARLLSTISQKPNDTPNLKVGSKVNDTMSFTKAFGKHAPYLLAEYAKIQTSSTSSISTPALKVALLPGLYSLLDLCGEYEREMIMAGLDMTGKTILKALYQDYIRDHKYTGR